MSHLSLSMLLTSCVVAASQNVSNRNVRSLRGSGRARRLWEVTDITEALNSAIEQSAGWDAGIENMPYDSVYSSADGHNKGIIFRNYFDGLPEDLKYKVATFWHNDIFSPSQAYPSNGNIMAPNSQDGSTTSWETAVVGQVVSDLSTLWEDVDNIQSDSWDKGTFYAHDSNAVDKRCVWWEDQNAYECPGFWCPWGEDCVEADDKPGPSAYGGQGCHFNGDIGMIDQPDAFNADGLNLVSSPSCECEYGFKDGTANSWAGWVEDFKNNLVQKEGVPTDEYFWYTSGLAPQYAMDYGICWVRNPRDMILLQNQLHFQNDWVDHSGGTYSPKLDDSPAFWWGWNEVPVPASVDDPANWDAIAIKLPTGVDTPDSLTDAASVMLEADLDKYVTRNLLLPGIDNIALRPGSYVVFAKQMDDGSQSNNYQTEFICSEWQGKAYHICSVSMDSASGFPGQCYIEKADTDCAQ